MVNIKKGDYFTVVRWTSDGDNSYVGEAFKADCVDGPLIRSRLCEGWGKGSVISLTQDNLELRHLSEEYMASVFEEEARRDAEGYYGP